MPQPCEALVRLAPDMTRTIPPDCPHTGRQRRASRSSSFAFSLPSSPVAHLPPPTGGTRRPSDYRFFGASWIPCISVVAIRFPLIQEDWTCDAEAVCAASCCIFAASQAHCPRRDFFRSRRTRPCSHAIFSFMHGSIQPILLSLFFTGGMSRRYLEVVATHCLLLLTIILFWSPDSFDFCWDPGVLTSCSRHGVRP